MNVCVNSAPLRMGLSAAWLIFTMAVSSPSSAKTPPKTPPKTPEAIITTATSLLELAQISYVYGGSRLGDGNVCNQCNSCLEERNPEAKKRLVSCPICADCSLDCSHFIELVYRLSGTPYPYLDTKLMIGLSRERLAKSYQLEDLGTRIELAQPGDMFVYDGHVVLLERLQGLKKGALRGDIVHATGGKDIRLPGQGIQRERYVELQYFRGPLRRILRHAALTPRVAKNEKTDHPRLRPVK